METIGIKSPKVIHSRRVGVHCPVTPQGDRCGRSAQEEICKDLTIATWRKDQSAFICLVIFSPLSCLLGCFVMQQLFLCLGVSLFLSIWSFIVEALVRLSDVRSCWNGFVTKNIGMFSVVLKRNLDLEMDLRN